MPVNIVPGWETPKSQPMKKYSPAIAAAIQQELNELYRDGILTPLSGALVHMVLKPSSLSRYCFCIDYSELSKSTMIPPFPLSNIQFIFESVEGAKIYGKLDLRKGYWQFLVAPEDRLKGTVQMLGSVYEPPVVLMGFVESQYHV